MSILSPTGGINRVPISGVKAYIAFYGAGVGLGHALMTMAPAESVIIQDSVDIAVNKALSGDYTVASFGYSPVSITISGLDLYGTGCFTGTNIQSFYDNFNVHKNKAARVDVGITDGSSTGSCYRCVLIALERMASADDANRMCVGIGHYTVKLIGVKL